MNWDYVTGLVYAPKENVFYWNKYEGEGEPKSFARHLRCGHKNIKDRTHIYQRRAILRICLHRCRGSDGAAGQADNRCNFFPKREPVGHSEFHASIERCGRRRAGGQPSTGEVKLDDTAYKSGSSGAGSKQTVEILNVSQGMHTFAVTVTAGKAKERKGIRKQIYRIRYSARSCQRKIDAGWTLRDAVTTG